jgi:carboxypeptidase D
MARLSRALALLILLGGTLFVGTAARTFDPSLRSLNAKRLEAAKRWEHSARGRNGAGDFRRATDISPPSRVKNITFTNPKASGAYATGWVSPLPVFLSHVLLEFYVNGATIPLVNFDVGPSWSGLIPISSAADETRKVWLLENFTDDGFALLILQLFFWFFPPGPEGSLDDLIFWYAVYLDSCVAGS